MQEPGEVRTNLRIPHSLYERLKALAEKDRRSINTMMVICVEKFVEIEEKNGEKPLK